eukprot:scaffold1804_cov263-Pinguiococcus_pyrenoidosus.AAC.4
MSFQYRVETLDVNDGQKLHEYPGIIRSAFNPMTWFRSSSRGMSIEHDVLRRRGSRGLQTAAPARQSCRSTEFPWTRQRDPRDALPSPRSFGFASTPSSNHGEKLGLFLHARLMEVRLVGGDRPAGSASLPSQPFTGTGIASLSPLTSSFSALHWHWHRLLPVAEAPSMPPQVVWATGVEAGLDFERSRTRLVVPDRP